jgi:iron complex outermembrane receptor protein
MTRTRRRKLSRINGLKHHPVVRKGIPVASTLLASLPWAMAQAQEQTVGLQEVVVTAQKRVENLQDVPISVQVFDTTKIEQLNITDVDGYVKYTPSLSYSRGNGQGGSGAPGQSLIYIRGVVNGGDGNHSGSQPAVGTYFDEQPVTTIDGTPEMHLYDIQRIEVLQGPQGTLFGASSESGTVRIITNKPDATKFSANLTVEGNQVDHGGTGWEAEGFVNLPLTDWAAVRLVGWAQDDAGYIDDVMGTSANGCIVNGIRTFPQWSGQQSGPNANYPVPYPCPTPGVVGAGAISGAPYVKSNFNPVETRGGRGALKLDIGPNWTVTPSAMAQEVKTEGFFGYDPQVGDLQVTRFGPDHTQDSWYQLALTVEGKMSDFDVVYAGAYFKRTNHTLAEYSDYSLFYDRVYGSGVYWTGNNGKPIMPQEFVIGGGYFEKWSQELRVSTPTQYPIHGTVGGFLQRQLHNIVQQYTMPGYGYTHITSDPGVPGNPNGFSDYYSLPNLPNTIWLTDEQRVDRDKAIFAQFDWDITPQLTLTGGIRQYWFDNSLIGFFGYSSNYSSHTGMATCFEPAYTKNSPCTNLNTSTSDHGNVPKITLTWKMSPDKMVYATYSKGFRPGGVNRIAGPNGVPYQPDYLKNYEIGWKTQWWDRRLRWNGALFWEDWQNFQFGFLVPPSITAITNAGNARIKGWENDIIFLPTNSLTLSANFTVLHAVTTQNLCANTGVTDCPNDSVGAPFLPPAYTFNGPLALSGTDLPQVPKFKGNVVVRYTFSDISEWQPFGQAAFVYQSKEAPKLKQNEQYVAGFQPAFGLLDLSAGASHNGTDVTLYVSNVTDKRAQLSRFANISPNNDNQIYIVPSQPRTFGLRVSQNF